MQEARSDRAWTRPWVRVALAVCLLAASAAVAITTVGDLGIGSLRLVDRPAEPSPADAELYVVLSGDGDPAPEDRAFRISQEVVSAQLEADPAVVSVRPERQGDDVILVADFGDASAAEREQAAERLAETVDPGALGMRIGGEAPRRMDDRDELEEELWRKELLVVPLALVALIFAVGVRMVAAPVLCAAIAITGALAGLGLIGGFADVSLLGVAPAAAVGLVLGLELPLRALRARDAPEREPRLALAVGVLAALPGFALLATPLAQAGSLALGAALAAILAAGAALLLAPAIAVLVPERPSEPRPRSRHARRRRALLALGVALIALCGLTVPAVVWGETAPFAAFDRALGAPEHIPGDSLFEELPLAAAIAVGVVSAALAVLARDPLALALGPLSLLPAGAAIGVCALLAEHSSLIGRDGAEGALLETGVVATAVCALAAIGCARSASTALWLSVGRRLELVPILVATAIGILAAAALYATELEQAKQLGIALGAGLAADLALVRLPLLWLVNGRIGSTGE